jgi:hypothetical protein
MRLPGATRERAGMIAVPQEDLGAHGRACDPGRIPADTLVPFDVL